MENEKLTKNEEIIFIENSKIKFETGHLPNRNEMNVIDGIQIINPLKSSMHRRFNTTR